ncbi:MAG TPA: nicotinate-nucleotide adenylyltransferase [Candidatus Eisenbacteria bacterium]|nr:nicotinate-nucleotide adenylyltransferase [Candidatus Eisenbacteria bacterium]
MNIGLFGGTFDPIHRGHLKVARAAARRFKLREVWFIPADIPPHKQKAPVTSYFHRYSMVVLALADEPDFLPSLLEAPEPVAHMERRPSYSIDTVRRVKAGSRRGDRLYFLTGIDAFRDIAKWHKAEELLRECEFIVAARPGYSLADVGSSLPKELRPSAAELRKFRKSKLEDALRLPGVTLHLLPETHEDVSATQIRAAIKSGTRLKKLVPDAVADYIRKEKLYRGRRGTAKSGR